MALRGENIGTAYVRILADGTGLDKSVRDQMEDVDWDGMGRSSSDEFTKGWEKEQKKAPNQKRLRDAISGPLVKGEWLTTEFFRSNNWNNFRAGLTKEFGEAGKRAGENLETRLYEGMNFDQLDRQLENLTPMIVKAQKQIDKELIEEQRRLEQERGDLIAQGLEAQAQTEQQKAKNARQSSEEQRRAEREALADTVANEKLRRRQIGITRAAYTDLMELVERMNKGEEETPHNRKALIKQLQNLRLEMNRLGLATHTTNDRFRDNEERLFRMNPLMRRFTKGADDAGVAIGKAFGKGSRNDFLNFQGAVAGGLSRLVLTFIPRAIGSIQSYVGKLRFAAAEGKSVLGVLGKDVGKIVGGLGGALGGLFLIIGPLVSIFSQLLGAGLALVSTIGFGLTGAVAALAGSLLPLGAAIGVTILGFKNLDGEAKKAAKGVANAFKDLGEDAADGLTFRPERFERNLGRIEEMVTDLGPVVERAARGVAEALNDAVSEGGAFQKGGSWDKFLKAMQSGGGELGWLGQQTRIVGNIFSNVFGGMLGLFQGLMPITHDFLSWVRDVAVDFRKWSNSAQGIQDTRTWLEWAADSARELGGFLAAVAEVMGTILDAGSEQGDSLFRSMTDSLNEWNTELEKDGGKGLREWFADSAKFIRKVGDAFVEILGLFKDLDTAASRRIATFAFETLGRVIETLGDILGPVVDLLDGLNQATDGATGKIAAAALIWPRLGGAMSGIQTKMSAFSGSMATATGRINALRGAARTAAGVGGIMVLGDALGDAKEEGGTFGDILRGAAGGAGIGAMFGPIGALIGAGAGAGLTGLTAAFSDTTEEAEKARLAMMKKEGFAQAKSDAESLRASLDGVVNAYGKVARKAIESSFVGSEGKLDADVQRLRDFGVSMDTITSAAMGQKDAINLVNQAFASMDTKQQSTLTEARRLWQDAQDGALTYTDYYGNVHNKPLDSSDIERLKKNYEDAKAAVNETKIAEDVFADRLSKNTGAIDEHNSLVQTLAESLGVTVKQYNKFPKEVRTNFESRGLPETREGALRLVHDYKDLQKFKNIKSLISAPGVDLTRKDIQGLAKDYKLTPKEVKTLLELEGIPKAVADTKKVKDGLTDLGKQRPKPVLDADSRPVDVAVDHATRRLFDLGNRIATPRIEVQSNVDSIVGDVNWALDHIADEVVNVVTKHTGGNRTASGGLFNSETRRIIGEAGPEAVVPLNRPLGMVDPSVRWLSAIAQGKIPQMARGGVVGGGKNVHVEQHIYSPNADPRAVANEAINHMVATGY